jgi:hypothetical protein
MLSRLARPFSTIVRSPTRAALVRELRLFRLESRAENGFK